MSAENSIEKTVIIQSTGNTGLARIVPEQELVVTTERRRTAQQVLDAYRQSVRYSALTLQLALIDRDDNLRGKLQPQIDQVIQLLDLSDQLAFEESQGISVNPEVDALIDFSRDPHFHERIGALRVFEEVQIDMNQAIVNQASMRIGEEEQPEPEKQGFWSRTKKAAESNPIKDGKEALQPLLERMPTVQAAVLISKLNGHLMIDTLEKLSELRNLIAQTNASSNNGTSEVAKRGDQLKNVVLGQLDSAKAYEQIGEQFARLAGALELSASGLTTGNSPVRLAPEILTDIYHGINDGLEAIRQRKDTFASIQNGEDQIYQRALELREILSKLESRQLYLQNLTSAYSARIQLALALSTAITYPWRALPLLLMAQGIQMDRNTTMRVSAGSGEQVLLLESTVTQILGIGEKLRFISLRARNIDPSQIASTIKAPRRPIEPASTSVNTGDLPEFIAKRQNGGGQPLEIAEPPVTIDDTQPVKVRTETRRTGSRRRNGNQPS